MKLKDTQLENKDVLLKVTDLDNFFHVNYNVDGKMMLNLNETLALRFNKDDLPEYICDYNMFWPLISYRIYSTTRLAWLLMKVNEVKPEDIFKCVYAGHSVKYVPNEVVQNLANIIREH